VPERHSPSPGKGNPFELANARSSRSYSTKGRIVEILPFKHLNRKMVEAGRIPAQGLLACFHPLKFLSGNVENN